MSWRGTNQNTASWNPENATAGGGGSDVGNLVNTPTEPQTQPYVNPTLTLVSRNTIPYPTQYDTMSINNLTVDKINGSSPSGGSTWSLYRAISDVKGTLDSFGSPQYSISDFAGVRAVNLTATSNVYASYVFASGSVLAVDVEAGSTMSVGTIAAHNGSLIVNGGTTLDGGTYHGTTIGSLPVSGINTVRIDVLPIGIDMVSPTYITMEAGGAINMAAGGAASVAGGSYVELNSGSGDIRCISSGSGNDNTVLYTGKITAGYSGSAPLHIYSNRGVQIDNGTTWNTTNLNSNISNSTQTSVKSYTTFNSYGFSTVYIPGDKVLFSGVDYTAQFITQSVTPSTNVAPDWVSGYTGYVIGSSVTSGTYAYSCLVNSPNTFEPPNINTDQWFSLGLAPHTWWYPTGDTKGELLFTPNSGDTYTYAIIKPTETQDGLYIQKTNASGVIVNRGLIYDSTINPPPANPIITADLNMNDYNILNTDNLYVATLNGNNASYITMDADLYFYGGSKTIHDLNILFTNQIVSNGSTIHIGSDLIATAVNLTGLAQVGTDSLSDGYSSNGILLGTNIKGNGQNIANVGAFSSATIGASTGNTSVGFTTNLNMNSNNISAVGTIGTNNISAPSGTITLQNNLNANSKNISGIDFLSTTNLSGNGGGAIELGGNIAGNDYMIDGLGNVGTTNISGVSGSNVTMSTNLDMSGHSILNVSPFPIINATNIHADNIYSLTGTTVTFHNDIVMAGTTEITGAYLITSDAINTDTIATQRATTIEVRNDFVMDGNNITNVGTVSTTNEYVDNLYPLTGSTITMNGSLNLNNNNVSAIRNLSADQINTDVLNSLNGAGITLQDSIFLNSQTLYGGGFASILDVATLTGSTLQIDSIFPYTGAGDILLHTNFNMNNNNIYGIQTLGTHQTNTDLLTSNTVGADIILLTNFNLNNNNIYGVQALSTYQTNTDELNSLNGGGITLQDDVYLNAHNLYGGGFASIFDLNTVTGNIFQTNYIYPYTGGGDITMYTNLNMNQNSINNINIATLNTLFMGISDTALFYELHFDSLAIGSGSPPFYLQYSADLTNFTPVAADWSAFAAYQNVDLGGNSIGNAYGLSCYSLYADVIRPTSNPTTSIGKFSTGGVQQPMIQSGSGNTGTTYYQVTFPTAYTSNTYKVSVSYTQNPTGNSPVYVVAGTKTTTGFRVHGQNNTNFDWVSFGTSYT